MIFLITKSSNFGMWAIPNLDHPYFKCHVCPVVTAWDSTATDHNTVLHTELTLSKQ